VLEVERLAADVLLVRAPGQSAKRRFTATRWTTARKNKGHWLGLATLTATCLAYIVMTDGRGELIAAGVVGANVTLAFLSWAVGDVRALRYLWGAIGEEQTADLLAELDEQGWTVEHDRPSSRGNWDHVVVGPSGIYLIDTKRLAQPARVAGDALVSGRLRFSGASFRAAAAELSGELGVDGWKPWVQPIVAIWGDFPQAEVERDGVIYLRADKLVGYLKSTVRRGS
jgi:Nuclease-related domain